MTFDGLDDYEAEAPPIAGEADTDDAARIDGERATAEFNCPLNGNNLRRPLRRARAEQGDLFRTNEGPRQERLW